MEVLNLIQGKLLSATGGEWLDLTDPSKGKVYGRLPRSGAEDVNLAVESANKAFKSWSATPPAERAACLNRLADLVAKNAQHLSGAESTDNGKPISLAAAVDIPRAEKNLRFYASAVQHFASESHAMEGEAINYTLRKPLGVVACISPWNLPLYLFTWKIAPALASGPVEPAPPQSA